MLFLPLVSLLLSSRLDQRTFSLYNISVLPRRKAVRTMKVIKYEKNIRNQVGENILIYLQVRITELSLKSMCLNHSVTSS